MNTNIKALNDHNYLKSLFYILSRFLLAQGYFLSQLLSPHILSYYIYIYAGICDTFNTLPYSSKLTKKKA